MSVELDVALMTSISNSSDYDEIVIINETKENMQLKFLIYFNIFIN